MHHPAWMSKKLEKNTVECLACTHRCKISPSKTGICGVRKNNNGTLELLVYGKSIATNIDPIEKKPLFHFYLGSEIFSIGTVGCNFSCKFCQNWEISQYPKLLNHMPVEDVGETLLPEDVVAFCKENSIPSIAFTYNEPAIFFEYAYDCAKLAHENGLNVVYVSNGYETPEALKKILPYLDAANIDLKAFTQSFYGKICGGRIEPVKKTIWWLWKKGVWEEVTTLVIPGENDDPDDLQQIAEFLVAISPDIPWHLSRYHPCYKMSNPPTSLETLQQAYEIGKKAGLHHVYVGNISEPERENTYCPNCNTTVIARNNYTIKNSLTNNNHCPYCKTIIAGKFPQSLPDKGDLGG
ncbi:MAG: AmmeMemoRadiSam system radical SAM enzyme [bacterium]